MVQSSVEAPFASEIMASILAVDSWYSCEESVNAVPKVVGSPCVLLFPPTGNVDRVGWD